MNIKELRILSLIIKYDTLGDVAHILNMTQPGVSRSVKSLEKKLGNALFHRHKNKLIPTKYALHLAEQSAPLLEDYDILKNRFFGGEESTDTEILRIICPNIYSMILTIVLKRMPTPPRINVLVTPSPQVMKTVTQQNYHLGVVAHTTPTMGTIKLRPMVQSPMRCLVHKDSDLAHLSIITPQDLINHRIIHTYHHRSDERKNIARIFRHLRTKDVPYYEVDTYMACELVGANAGIGICSDIVCQITARNNPNTRVIHFSEELYQSLYWITPSDSPENPQLNNIIQTTHHIINQYSPDSNTA